MTNTILALQKFFSIWKQNPTAQYNLEIFSQNAILGDAQKLEQVIDVTPTKEPDPSNALDELLRHFDKDIEALLTTAITEKPKAIVQLFEDLTQTLNSQKTAQINPFLGETGITQVDKILQELPNLNNLDVNKYRLLKPITTGEQSFENRQNTKPKLKNRFKKLKMKEKPKTFEKELNELEKSLGFDSKT